MVRQPTDPDPYDERRGISGYTFAFGDEPDLNRIIYFQPDRGFPLRSHCPPFGVRIHDAFIVEKGGNVPVPPLLGARVYLLGDPMLENRNWTLTAPGFEPIVPFHIRIAQDRLDFSLERLDVIDPSRPDTSYLDLPLSAIEAKGARGLAYEPATVGPATGVYNYYFVALERRELLRADLEKLRITDPLGHDPRSVVIEGRLSELDAGIEAYEAGEENRRTAVHPLLERFGYYISGNPTEISDPNKILPFVPDLDADAKWRIDFWMGGWDFDALCCMTKGQLQIPLT